MYAIIETGGKQYRIKEKDVLMVEKLEAEEGTVITFDKVLAILKDGDIQTGSSLENAKVTAKVLTHGKGKKIMVFKTAFAFLGKIFGFIKYLPSSIANIPLSIKGLKALLNCAADIPSSS